MEAFGLEQPLCGYSDSMDALPELWESNAFDSPMTVELREDGHLQHQGWPTCLNLSLMSDDDGDQDLVDCDHPVGILRDRLITDAAMVDLSTLTTCTTSTKSSMGQDSPLLGSSVRPMMMSAHPHKTYHIFASQNDDDGDDIDSEINEDTRSNHEMTGDFCDPLTLNIKSEPPSPVVSADASAKECNQQRSGEKRKRTTSGRARDSIKMKPISSECSGAEPSPRVNVNFASSNNGGSFMLPPTPPSSTSSDSEGSLSPMRDAVSPKLEAEEVVVVNVGRRLAPATSSAAPQRVLISKGSATIGEHSFSSANIRHPINSPLISYQPKGSTGTLQLTEEEKRTLLAEGYPVPTRLPLTKAEEKSLKKIRRKIKNKISAQESRRKKKEYMDTLERRAAILEDENHDFRQRLHQLEADNIALQHQLNRFQNLLNQSGLHLQIEEESQLTDFLPKSSSSRNEEIAIN